MSAIKNTPADILDFWYADDMKKAWFSSTPEIDENIRQRYEKLWQIAINKDLDDWKNTADGCLALIILLDQLPLNMFRGTAQSFSSEQQAVAACYHAIKEGFDQDIIKQSGSDRIAFLYMPLMHSEDISDQNNAVKYFEAAELKGNINFAKHHRKIIEKFARFPHRNKVLGRKNSTDETVYLNSKEAFLG
ncbi:MAG TPA: DUF924 domain-containing protein [Leucothrix mucor]|nr:DUF924 domain-containing protein [Leucothrix mucor]